MRASRRGGALVQVDKDGRPRAKVGQLAATSLGVAYKKGHEEAYSQVMRVPHT
jgi:hypothetical protein